MRDAREPVMDPVFGFALSDSDSRLIYGNNTQIEGVPIPKIDGPGTIELELMESPLARGNYLFSFSVHSSDHRTNYHRLDHHFSISIQSDKSFEGCCFIPCTWHLPE